MREIKFRAWDIIRNRYYQEVQNVYDENIGDNFQNVLDDEELLVEQYTGIKDKNGVEIYEGDIVAEINQFDDDEPDVYEVVYNETGDYPAFDLKGWTGEVNGISELSLTYGIEVIGNIHENADLLEEQ